MIISDLQYIENVDNSEVLGGGGWKDKYKDYYKKYKKNTAEAVADAESTAIGDNTLAVTNTFTVADSDAGVSLSGSSSYAKASTYYKHGH